MGNIGGGTTKQQAQATFTGLTATKITTGITSKVSVKKTIPTPSYVVLHHPVGSTNKPIVLGSKMSFSR